MTHLVAAGQPYQHQLRDGRQRWWRPLVALLFFLVVWVTFGVLVLTGATLVSTVLGISQSDFDIRVQEGTDPVGLLVGNLMLASAIPASILALRVVHRAPWGILHSVLGRLRIRWMAVALALAVAVIGPVTWFGELVAGSASYGPHPQAAWMLLVVLLTTPLQAAGEEYAMRGFPLMSLGSWFRGPVVGFWVATTLSAVAFASMHGSTNPFVVFQLLLFAVCASVLTWRTGGLEAAIALHAVHNVFVFSSDIATRGGSVSYADTAGSSSPWLALTVPVRDVLAVVLLLYVSRRMGIVRTRVVPQVSAPVWPAMPIWQPAPYGAPYGWPPALQYPVTYPPQSWPAAPVATPPHWQPAPYAAYPRYAAYQPVPHGISVEGVPAADRAEPPPADDGPYSRHYPS